MSQQTNTLIIGAGPFGLAMAAYLGHLGIEHIVVGKLWEFWRDNMPRNMYLRSASDWHLDPLGKDTIESFLEEQGLTPEDVEPLSRDFYLSYLEWFRQQKQIGTLPVYVNRLTYDDAGDAVFRAILDDSETVEAQHVVIAVGFKYFKHEPAELTRLLPSGRYTHTCDHVDFTQLKGKRVMIIGGRQSAFEWTALLNEAGADAVHVVHRHDTPAFTEADWSWVNPLVDDIATNPGWFRNLSQEEKNAVNHRLWAEGRLKVEPWLEERVMKDTVTIWPNTQVVGCQESSAGALEVSLDNDGAPHVDHIILATGYKVDIDRVPFLANGNILPALQKRNGFPVLDEHFQTNIPGLFITSMAATQDFGPFFGFTISVRTSAKLIGEGIGGLKE